MGKKLFLFTFSFFLLLGVLSCDFSGKIKDNQKEVSFLKENYRLLTESVSQYERMVKKMNKEIDYLKKRVRVLEDKLKKRR